MKFLDNVIVNNDFYKNAEGIIIDKRGTGLPSPFFNRNSYQYLVTFNSSNIQKWIDEEDIVVKETTVFIPHGVETK